MITGIAGLAPLVDLIAANPKAGKRWRLRRFLWPVSSGQLPSLLPAIDLRRHAHLGADDHQETIGLRFVGGA